MTKILVIITCIVVLTVHGKEFRDKINLERILEISYNIMNQSEGESNE
tara:strand:- start:143 stop:286 length:144 start_codon:yes stop_codon:yes gene_type:complete